MRTYQRLVGDLRDAGWKVTVIQPSEFRCVPLPSDPNIPIAVNVWRLPRRLRALQPDCVHLATEGPLGMMARLWCGFHGYRFTTSFHTKFPEFIQERMGVPLFLTYALARWFHNGAAATLAPTPSLMTYLRERGFMRCTQWTHGVDAMKFHPSRRTALPYAKPVALYVGRVSVEKNLAPFLSLDMPGTKLIVGEGPGREELEKQFPAATFLGAKYGDELARLFASADVFVFPSLTDTFGLVLLESLASGTPIAGYPVTGPIDVANDERVGGISQDLGVAITHALTCSRDECRKYAERFSWDEAERIFVESLVPMRRKPVTEAKTGERPQENLS